jgi:hypothetical protein
MSDFPDLPFHDAEVVRLLLDRDGPTLELDIEVFAQLPKARIERLRFLDVDEVEIGGFNEQNVLFDVKAERGSDGLWNVKLQSSYGLNGEFRCRTVQHLSG